MKRRGVEKHGLAPWADNGRRLESFRFIGARQVSPGVILVSTGEDNFHLGDQGVSTDDPAVSRALPAQGQLPDRRQKVGAQLADVSDEAVREVIRWAEMRSWPRPGAARTACTAASGEAARRAAVR